MFELPSFFNSKLEPFIGKVVSQKAQKAQIGGMGWGHRFKVRIMGTYSENDNVEDNVNSIGDKPVDADLINSAKPAVIHGEVTMTF